MPTTPSEEEEGSPMLLDAMGTVTVTCIWLILELGVHCTSTKSPKTICFPKINK